MAIGRKDGSLTIYDIQNIFKSFFFASVEKQHTTSIASVAFGAGGSLLAAGMRDGTVSLYLESGGWSMRKSILVGPTVEKLKWSHHARYLAYASTDKPFSVIDTLSWTEVDGYRNAQQESLKQGNWSRAIDWSWDGRWIASGTDSGGLKVYNTKTFQQIVVPNSK